MTHQGTERLIDLIAISEPFSSFSHLLGSAGALVGTFFLLHHARGRLPRLVSFAVFGFITTAAMALSGVYHLLEPGTTARAVFQRLDHAAIWLTIAAAFTPTHRLLFEGFARWGVLVIVWGCALVGIAIKTVYFDSIPNWLGVTSYCALGSVGLWSYLRIQVRFGVWLERPLFWAGVFFLIGALAEGTGTLNVIPGVIGPHEIMHTAVLIGLVFQWVFMVRIADLLAAQDTAMEKPRRRLKKIRDRIGITGSGPVGAFRVERPRKGLRMRLMGRFWRRSKEPLVSKEEGAEEGFTRHKRRPYWRRIKLPRAYKGTDEV